MNLNIEFIDISFILIESLESKGLKSAVQFSGKKSTLEINKRPRPIKDAIIV